MKKKIGIALAVFIGATAMGLGMYHSDAAQAEPKLSTEEIEQLVKDQYPGEITEMELEKNRNRAVYDIEIHDGQKEYEIKMDGNTGEVLKLEEKMIASNVKQSNEVNDDDNNDDSNNKAANTNKSNDDTEAKKGDNSDDDNKKVAIKEKDDSTKDDKNKSSKKDDDKSKVDKAVIDIGKAKEIALNAFSGTIVSIDLDEDDGRLLYELEMDTNKREAEIEIDAYTGEVLVLDIAKKDNDDDDNDSNDNNDDSDDSSDDDNDDDNDDDADDNDKN